MPARDYASTRFSRLRDIDANNVNGLKLAWSFDTGVAKGQEAAPIVVGDTMFVVTPAPNQVFAINLRAAPKLRWKYAAKQVPAAAGGHDSAGRPRRMGDERAREQGDAHRAVG